ncbi:MAG: hypothetical protein ACE5EO_01775 [Candidatus Krumholzibacteriia bacterium]
MIYLALKGIYVKKRLALYVRTVVVLSFFATPACYTLFKHPRVKRVIYEEVTDRRCNGCHEKDELRAFHNPPNQLFRRGRDRSAWNRYYDVPWWYNEYWYYDQDAIDTTKTGPFQPGAGRIPAERRNGALRAWRGGSSPPEVDKGLPAPGRKARNEASKKRTV